VYRNERLGAAAEQLIDAFTPDVAHIHHLTCLSTTIVRALAERRIPCFVTLHDYWLICHRGQLLNVRDEPCDGPEPYGCHACLGPVAGMGRFAFVGAAAIRRIASRVGQRKGGSEPTAAGRGRRIAAALAALTAATGRAHEEERRRLEHMRDVCASVTHFFAPSRFMRDRFLRFGIAPERITVAPYGVDHGTMRQAGRTVSDRLRVGFLGSLMVSKGVHVLLEAAATLPESAIAVDLFGPWSAYHGDDSYRGRIAPLMRANVKHHGHIAHQRVADALGSIDVLAVPSIWPENSPFAIHEAFLAGVPVVASRTGGIPEVVSDGRNGLLFRTGDSTDLARTLSRFLTDPGLLERLRAGIAPPRTIEDDVAFLRAAYLRHRDAAAHPERRTASHKLAAIVLNFRTPDDTFLAVKSLLASRRQIDEIVVVDNDPEDACQDGTNAVAGRITRLSTGRNLGFAAGMNAGIRHALARGANRVLLVNSDVIVPPDCVERLEQCLEEPPEAGIVGPVLLSRSEPDRLLSLGLAFEPSTGRMRHRGAGRIVSTERIAAAADVEMVSGCVMLVTREVFVRIGLLQEQYFFGFEDLDFCLEARRAGFGVRLAGTAKAYHEGGRSIGARSPAHFYFAARNHLLLASRSAPRLHHWASLLRGAVIVTLNLAHALRQPDGSTGRRLLAVVRGALDYRLGRFGPAGFGRSLPGARLPAASSRL
jgi:GT2 family glycosyltransferase/glycosyltransferase involved in cell wall biosynthesis